MDFLARFERRDFVIVTGLLVFGVAALLGTFVLKPAWESYYEVSHSRDLLVGVIGGNARLDDTIVELQQETRRLRARIYGDVERLPVSEMEAYIMGKLQQVSWNHQIELSGVTPREGDEIDIFQGFVFEIQMVARFFDLVNWLGEIQHDLGFAVLENFTLTADTHDEPDPKLNVRVTITSYRAVD